MTDNTLIAHFMGYKIETKNFQYQHFHSSNESNWEWDKGDIVTLDGYEVPDHSNEPYFSLDALPFHTWELLMPIVNKCKSLGNADGINKILLERTIDETKLFNAVVEFIKDYNGTRMN